MFLPDMAVQGILVLPLVPQVVALHRRQPVLSWLPGPDHLFWLPLLLPLVLPLVVDLTTAPIEHSPPVRALKAALISATVMPVVVLELAWAAGTNLLNARYATTLLVPAALLAGMALGRTSRGERTVLSMAVLLLCTSVYVGNLREFGNFSGAGSQDWRAAVAALDAHLLAYPDAPVLYRSGFVEEDGEPLGSPPPATRAPLRSPGQAPRERSLVPLTFRWDQPTRESYFEHSVGPALADAPAFFLLSLGATDAPQGSDYADRVGEWVRNRLPRRLERTDLLRRRHLRLVMFRVPSRVTDRANRSSAPPQGTATSP
jgi:hypothetical protein